jgi:hypothetical protein
MTKKRLPILFVVAACSGGGNRPAPAVCDTHDGGGLADHDVPCDPGANGILLTASGEPFAINGYHFPPASDQEVSLDDGWEITFDRVLTTFDKVTLSSDPDLSPTDQSLSGPAVAELDGPFAIDLHAGGAATGKDGEPAALVGAFTGQNLAGNAAFDPSVRYAFGFDVVAATASAHNINLDPAAVADYQQMVQRGYTTLLVGTATWKGDASCATTIAGYDYSKLPTVVHFRLGVVAPATYVNAQNPENDPAAPFAGEEHQRGVHTLANTSTTAQLTFHLDHVFWDSFVHDSPAHFDQFAARYAGATSPPTATLEDFVGFSFTPVVDALGQPLPWRECLGQTPPTQGAMTFDTNGVPVDPRGDPRVAMRDFFDYVHHNQSTFGHLNADGLTFVVRHYPSPP